MKFTVVMILILAIVSCKDTGGEASSGTADTIVKISDGYSVTDAKLQRRFVGLIWSSDNVQVYGDTTIEKGKIYLASIKFEPYVSFEDFKVDELEKVKADLDFSSNQEAYRFKTRIRTAYESDTANFAGHYTFAWWGCGSPCQSGVIVDRRTGKIYHAPEAALGYNFKPDSRMLLVNPPDSLGFYDDCFYCKPIIYVLDERTKEFVKRRPK